jgi:methionyl-tRNA formyltransferase
MSNLTQSARLPRVLFFGMQGKFSYPSLRALLDAGIQVCAVIISADQSYGVSLPVIQRRIQPQSVHSTLPVLHSSFNISILDLAWERNIPIWEVRQLSDPATIRVLATYQPDMICVACFSKRIPTGILDIPTLGCLNVHPALLPTNRGPEPLFWTFREGNQRTGVTIHLIDEGMDSGAIVAQKVLEIPDGIGYPALEAQSAEIGGELLVQSVWNMFNGVARPIAQDETKRSYHAFPSKDDFVVPVAEWDARRVYNFICGIESWGMPITLLVDNIPLYITKAISYSLEAIIHDDTEVYRQPGEAGLWISCQQGSVLVV